METKQIRAMKNGGVKVFSQHSWDIANPEAQGWVKIGEVTAGVLVGAEPIPIVKSDIEVVGVDGIPIVQTDIEVVEVDGVKAGDNLTATPSEEELDEGLYPTDEEIRAYATKLFDNGEIPKMPHHALGTKKLRKFYNENLK